MGARLSRKSVKDSPALLPIMMFGGSPISVAVPPMFAARTSAIRKGTTGSRRRWQTARVTGATRSMTVTLSRKAETTAVSNTKMIISRKDRPRLFFAAQIAR